MYIQGKVLCPGICGCQAVEKDVSVILLQPSGEHLAVLLVGIDEVSFIDAANIAIICSFSKWKWEKAPD